MTATGILTVPHLDRNTLARIFGRITISHETGCWLMAGCGHASGYKHVHLAGHSELAHRFFYAWLVEPIPRGRGRNILVLDHLCGNRACCNPAHLDLVSDAENLRRSNAPATVNSRKTHCIRGHLLPTAKIVSTSGKAMRSCRICKIAYDAARSAPLRKPRPTSCRNGHPLLGGSCEACGKAAKTRYYLANKERVIAMARAYKLANRDALNARRRELRASRRDLRSGLVCPPRHNPELIDKPR